MMKRLGYLTILLAMIACTSTDSNLPKLSVSIEPQRKILEEIVGDRYEVVSILANGANPETYDPTMSQRMEVDKSLAYFTTGYMPFEHTLAGSLGQGTTVVNTSEGIIPVTGTHVHSEGGHVHNHDDADPHVWASIRNAKIMAQNMTRAMAQLDPENATEYNERLSKLILRLDSLDTATAQRLHSAGTHAFMVWHPSLSYYARDYGLHQIAAGQESKEMSIGNLRNIIDQAKEDSVQVFFFQKEYDSRQAESLNKEIGSRMVTINPLAYDWEKELINITDELTR